MFYFIFALCLLVTTVVIHILFCRRRYGAGLQAKALVFIAGFFLAVYVIGVYLIGQAHLLAPDTLWGLPFRITAGFIFILLLPLYLVFYVLTQLTSPSKKILACLATQGSLSRAEILASIQQEDFINSRLNDLCISGCVEKADGRYKLSSRGRPITAALHILQRFLGREAGG